MIWDKHYECMSREETQAIQFQRLINTVKSAYERIPFYKKVFDEYGVSPQDIKTLEDITKLPFTTKEVLRDHYPFGLFAVPMKQIIRLHASSGTTGKPKVVGYTKNDIENWSELIARIVTMAGVTDEDIAQVSFGYGLFTGAFGLHYGLEKVGATIIPASVGNTKRQIMMMQDFGTTALISTPSYALYMAEAMEEMGVNPTSLNLKVGLFGAEPWTEKMRSEIENRLNIKATDNYGLSELMGPGVAGECKCNNGLHISEDHFLVEVLDTQTGQPVPYGQEGELVVTSLTKEAMPIIRYRTNDITVVYDDPCPCGRKTARMKKVTGRSDDMLIIRGINVYPSQIESVLMEIEGVSPYYQLVVSKKGHLDDLEVQVELLEDMFTGHYKDLEIIGRDIKERLQNVLSVSAKVKLLEPKSIERTTGKARRIIDNRPKE